MAQSGEIKLELGSRRKLESSGWTTFDLHGADIDYDLNRGIPLPEDTVEVIYSIHFLEHINFKDLLNFLEECREC
ncbi:hypothetical protein BM524_04510 [Alteromonas mediterranea]|uniref:Methyltransferase type 11 domain-containing protein n=1 Tax=Alteromonas mediterranea TaxID=314275 RepID=A0AAC9NRA5_9ALTE|nr:hypothetical protein BM524_04510 [Alteromonas mediterranea]